MQERSTSTSTSALADDFAPTLDVFRRDVLHGLSAPKKRLACKYFYDERGSQLFEAICELEEYYLTRVEMEIMRRSAPSMAARIGSRCLLVEYGSGSGIKTEILLENLDDPAGYVPVDISRKHMRRFVTRLRKLFPSLAIHLSCADFTKSFKLSRRIRSHSRKVIYFPGSTIGNFTPSQTLKLLWQIASQCGTTGGLLVGVDLQKEEHILQAAYNDSRGITAKFNLNLLRRINLELGGNFHLEHFRHHAVYNASAGRVEIYLISQRDQTVSIGEHQFVFEAGERIHTEYSHKYTVDGFATLASDAGLHLVEHWTDDQQMFAVLYLEVV